MYFQNNEILMYWKYMLKFLSDRGAQSKDLEVNNSYVSLGIL